MKRETILDSQGVARAIEAMADKILADDNNAGHLVLVGIRTGGMYLARRLQSLLEEKSGRKVPTGIIDINLYRDDWTRVGPKPIVGKTELEFSIDDKNVILVDDVLFTGRTIRSALDALMDFGRPARIEVAVLADRGYRELPICPTYTGLILEVGLDWRVNVYFSEKGHPDEVVVEGVKPTD